jgi:UDP-N-acetylmuramoylalanine--D-glutamate ligase
MEWQGKRVTVIGLGIEGEDLATYFATHGATVTASDRKDRTALAGRADTLERFGVHLHLGSNDPADVAGADLVCVSQGVPLSNPAVVAAKERGIPVKSMTSLFLDLWPGPVLGITGSSGKTTTTTLVDAIFTAAKRDHVFGGNVGIGLMSLLDQASPRKWAVLEISHTQLVITDRSPQIAGLLNVTPNHLDQFSWEEYVGLKRKIFQFQKRTDIAVFNADDPVSQELRLQAPGRVFLFSTEADYATDGAFLEDGTIFWCHDFSVLPVIKAAEIPLRGFHNVANVLAATALAAAADIGPEDVEVAVRGFKAPEHRLELVARVRGVDYVNDSIATAPERTLAALRSFEEPIVLLLGGRDKKLPLEELMIEAKARCRAAVCFGESGPLMADAAQAAGLRVERVTTLAEAVDAASSIARSGDVVLLSPACTSFDAYDNFELRGIEFRQLVSQLSGVAQ